MMRILLPVAIGLTLAFGIGGWWRSRRRVFEIPPLTPHWRHEHAYDRDGEDPF